MVLLVSFAKERNVSADTVATYIRRHKEDYEGHTTRKGNKLLLDDEALVLLDEVYPLPKPIEVIEDTESRKKLIKAQEYIISLQKQLSDCEIKLAKSEANELLLIDKQDTLNGLISDQQARLIEYQKSYDELQGKYEAEIKKSWWDKLRGK